MLLQTSSRISLTGAARKVFRKGELHVSRVFGESVLILMESGVLRFREDGDEVTLRAGEYYIQRNGLRQEGVPVPPEEDDPARYFFIHFSGGSYAEGGAGVPLRGVYPAKRVRPYVETLERNRAANRFLLGACLYHILGELAETSPAYDRTGDLLERLRTNIEDQYASDIELGDLAKRFGYSPDHLTRLFRKRYGTTIHRYLTDLRMERAQWYLQTTGLTVAAVAAEVGYRDLSAFYRAFLARYGVSPNAVRNPD